MTSWLYFNMQVSIPPTFDTTPCVETMLDYEDCVADANVNRKEFFMPAWPTLFPLWLHYKREPGMPFGGGDNELKWGNEIMANENNPIGLKARDMYYKNKKITDEQFQMLYECEEERMVYKSCLRTLIDLKKSNKHTSWDTADISALYLN